MEITFRPGKPGQFFTYYLIRFACIFFGFFFTSMSFTKLKIHRFPVIKKIFFELFGFQLCVSILVHKIRSSRSQMFFKIDVLKIFAVFTGKHQR